MRIAFVINSLPAERPKSTTTVLARAAHHRGHEAFLIEVGELTCRPDGHLVAPARGAPPGEYADSGAFLEAVRNGGGESSSISTTSLDVLWLRYNPGEYSPDERWATVAGMRLARLAIEKGVLVLDDPEGVFFAEDKLYMMRLPDAVRPRTLVSRRIDEVVRFHEQNEGGTVLKPVDGYGGQDVYLIRDDSTNLAPIVESLARRGVVLAQEFVPEAVRGDVRLFMMNGRPLSVEGRYAAIRRVNPTGDFRSNMTLGGTSERVAPDERVLRAAELVGPRLRADGVFLAGLDVVGAKVVEVNTLSPGGLHSAIRFEGVDFAGAVIQAIERKLERRRSDPELTNRQLAASE